MRFTTSYTFRSGSEADFDTVAVYLRQCYPNFDLFLRGLEQPEFLQKEARWRHHVLRQLTFSYLKKDYLARTVRAVLDQFPPDQDISVFQKLRVAVSDIVSGSPMTSTTVAELNNLAIAVADWRDANRTSLIEASMNALGRWLFGDATRTNRKRVEQYIAYLHLGLEHHMDVDTFGRRMREALSFRGYTDCISLKTTCLKALTTIRDDLLRVTNARCVFLCPDIKMYTESLSLGMARIFRWDAPDFQIFLSQQAKDHLKAYVERAPFSGYLAIEAQCHPDCIAESVASAAIYLQQITGFMVSQDTGVYHPPKQYGVVAFEPGTLSIFKDRPSGKPQNSLLMMKEDTARSLENNYREYMAPALTTPVERNLQERLRRTLRGFQKASFLSGSKEWSQAYSRVTLQRVSTGSL